MGSTIKDVAKLAGVSIATVSRVVNNKGMVAPEKEQQVLAAVQALKYTPNGIAQSLKQRRSKLIGMMASDFTVSFFVGVLQTLERELVREGYQIILGNTYDSSEAEKRLFHLMSQGKTDIILVNSTGGNDTLLSEAYARGVSILGYDRYPMDHAFPSVYVDKDAGIYLLLSYLYDLGHRRFCFLSGPAQLSTNLDRRAGIARFIRDKGLAPEQIQIREESFSSRFAQAVMEEMVAQPDPPTAYIAGSVALAIGIMKFCEAQHLSIPRDLSLASFGTFWHDDMIKPSLLHIDDEYTSIAGQLLLWIRQIEQGDGKMPQGNVVIQPRLVEGDSCAPPPRR